MTPTDQTTRLARLAHDLGDDQAAAVLARAADRRRDQPPPSEPCHDVIERVEAAVARAGLDPLPLGGASAMVWRCLGQDALAEAYQEERDETRRVDGAPGDAALDAILGRLDAQPDGPAAAAAYLMTRPRRARVEGAPPTLAAALGWALSLGHECSGAAYWCPDPRDVEELRRAWLAWTAVERACYPRGIAGIPCWSGGAEGTPWLDAAGVEPAEASVIHETCTGRTGIYADAQTLVVARLVWRDEGHWQPRGTLEGVVALVWRVSDRGETCEAHAWGRRPERGGLYRLVQADRQLGGRLSRLLGQSVEDACADAMREAGDEALWDLAAAHGAEGW